MSLSPGVKLGPYRIEAPLGAGGMGEVYRALDTRLDRTVAIKVLATQVAADPHFRERFEREAKAISALDHPHICTLYDVGHEPAPPVSSEGETPGAGIDYLVMQFLDGESLAERLARAAQPRSDSGSRPLSTVGSVTSATRGPIPLEQTLRFATQIAEALDAAHRHGIVHRDLKPGNVMLTKSGVKLLDFGLAKLREQRTPVAGGLTLAATRTAPITAEGAILGTLQYMSPEQLEGRDVDARSDIFAFGAILLEMLTGRRAFEGKSQAGVIAAILEVDAPALTELADSRSVLPGVARRGLDRLLRKCLAKNPDERWQCAADLADELKRIDEERLRGAGQADETAVPQPEQTIVPTPAKSARWWIVATAAASLLAIGIAAWTFLQPAPVAEPVRFVLLPPEKQQFSNFPALLSVSPDGRRLLFITTTDKTMLWLRPLDSLTARPLLGSESASQPFWSPDGRFVAFVVSGKLKRIDVSGGPPLTLADVSGTGNSRGAWSRQGVVLFGGPDNRLYRIPESGGQPSPVTELDKSRQEVEHLWPAFLPDGRRFIFLARSADPSKCALFLSSLDSPARTHLIDVQSSVDYANGYLLFQREGTLMAQPFDEKKGRVMGDATPLVENVNYNPTQGRGAFSASATGTLVYRTGQSAGSMALTWFDRTGKILGKVGELGDYTSPRLSPDGRRLIVARRDERRTWDLWLIDLDRNVPTRFTFDPADDSHPVWSPDGSMVVFQSNRKGVDNLYQRLSGGAAAEEALYESPENKTPMSFSPDGKLLLFTREMEKGKGRNIWALPMTGDRKPFSVMATSFNEWNAVFSPDGRWIAYNSDDSGADQVYVQPFPPTGAKVRLSTTNGRLPAWSADGKRIFYLTQDRHLMVVDVTTSGGELHAALPQELFVRLGLPWEGFTVDASGQRFLMSVPSDDQVATPLTVVLNWTSTVPKK